MATKRLIASFIIFLEMQLATFGWLLIPESMYEYSFNLFGAERYLMETVFFSGLYSYIACVIILALLAIRATNRERVFIEPVLWYALASIVFEQMQYLVFGPSDFSNYAKLALTLTLLAYLIWRWISIPALDKLESQHIDSIATGESAFIKGRWLSESLSVSLNAAREHLTFARDANNIESGLSFEYVQRAQSTLDQIASEITDVEHADSIPLHYLFSPTEPLYFRTCYNPGATIIANTRKLKSILNQLNLFCRSKSGLSVREMGRLHIDTSVDDSSYVFRFAYINEVDLQYQDSKHIDLLKMTLKTGKVRYEFDANTLTFVLPKLVRTNTEISTFI